MRLQVTERLRRLDRQAEAALERWRSQPGWARVGRHEPRPGTWRSRPRVSAWDLPRTAALPVIVVGCATWGAVAYLAAAIAGSTDPAGNHNRWLSALYGLGCVAVAVPVTTYIVLWLSRPARPSELWPGLSKRFSGRSDE